jgi:hypothetical protein
MLRWDFLGNFKESSAPLPGVYLGVSKLSAMSSSLQDYISAL